MLRCIGVALLLNLVSAAGWARDFQLGVTTHLASDEGLKMIATAGLASVRNDLSWEIVEAEKGQLVMHPRYEHYVERQRALGLRPMLILGYGNPHYDAAEHPRSPEAIAAYVRFCTFVVQHFRGRVFQYEIWNEWNAGTGMGQPASGEDYVKLLAPTRAAIRKVAPEVTVIGGVMSGNGLRNDWLLDACNAGLLEHLDALSFHPYCWGSPDAQDRLPEFGLVKRVRDLEHFIAAYPRGRTVPLYLTEVGWPTHTGEHGVSPDRAAELMARAVLTVAAMPRVRGLWWYGWSDHGEDETQAIERYGLVTFDGRPKPAYEELQEVTTFLRGSRGPLREVRTANTRSVSCRDLRGRLQVVAWSLSGRETLRIFAPSSEAGRRLRQRKHGADELVRSWDRRGATRSMLRVTIDERPTYLRR